MFKDAGFAVLDGTYNITSAAEIRNYSSGEHILTCSDKLDFLGIIASGRARIMNGDAVMREICSGDSFGAATVFYLDGISKTEIVAVKKCDIIILPKSVLTELIENESICAINYVRFLSSKVSFLNTKIAAFTAGSVRQKLCLYLSGLNTDSDGVIISEVCPSTLADMLNIGRASLYRTLDELIDEGIISRTGKQIRVLDNEKLGCEMQP